MTIRGTKHPRYIDMEDDYLKWRYTYESGVKFRDKYLQRLSTRESNADYTARRDMTYIPAFAKAALIEIKNSIFNRLVDVTRKGGNKQYIDKVSGLNLGVDKKNSSMNSFMGSTVLPELLAMKKVGIFVDSTRLANPTGTMLDDEARQVYMYIYKAEEIQSWSEDDDGLKTVLLKATQPVENELGLVNGEETVYRFYKRVGRKVEYTVYSDADDSVLEVGELNVARIPLVIGELPDSLLKEVADYQIAHMNMSSADVNYSIKANFPFYIEQQSTYGARPNVRRTNSKGNDTENEDGTVTRAGVAETPEIKVGAVSGRSYAQGANAPTFIHPSPEPLKVSMEKQAEMKREVRQLVQLAVTNMDPKRESAESKTMDARGLESGLSFVGQELEKIEREIANIWAMYQGGEPAEIKYPENYSLKSDSERRAEAEKLTDISKNSASIKYQKETAKLAASILLGNKVANHVLDDIHGEIDSATVAFVDPEQLVKDAEAGFVTTQLAAQLRGYGRAEADKAMEQRVQRAAMIVAAQASVKGPVENASARGVPDLESGNETPVDEKTKSQSTDVSLDSKKGVRGDG